jgi:hypothetical protein
VRYRFGYLRIIGAVENLIKGVSKHICALRKLKCKFNKQNLEKLYLIYIRPIFEYAKHDFSFVLVERHQPSL